MFLEQQLGQLRPANTTAASLYSPGVGVTSGVIKLVMITNVTNVTVAYSLFADDNGTTYDQTTALAWKIPLEGNSSDQFEGFYPMANTAGNFAVQTDSANGINFTAYGAEIT